MISKAMMSHDYSNPVSLPQELTNSSSVLQAPSLVWGQQMGPLPSWGKGS